jgi:hypothetical protein
LNQRFLPFSTFTNTRPRARIGAGITVPLRPSGSLTTVPGTIDIGVYRENEKRSNKNEKKGQLQ